MTALTIQEVSRRSGLSEPTLRYYEEVGLVGPVDRDTSSPGSCGNGSARWRPRRPPSKRRGDDLPPMVIRNDRARDELGWRPRPVEATVADTVQSLVERGELPGP